MVVLTANLPPRKPSKAARWALRLALFVPVLFVMALVAHGLGTIDTAALILLMAATGALCFVALLLWIVGLRSLWTHGRKGGQALSWALLVLSPFIVIGILVVYAMLTQPPTMQASTDLIAPPLFTSETRADGVNASAILAAKLPSDSSTLTGRRYGAPMEVVLERVGEVVQQSGWQQRLQRGRIGADDEISIEYRGSVPVARVDAQMVVRLIDEGDTVFVDVRARTPQLPYDLGYNGWSIDRLLDRLDSQMIGVSAL